MSVDCEFVPELAVYTAITGGYDRLQTMPEQVVDGASLTAFVDNPGMSQQGSGRPWQCVRSCSLFVDPNRNAKIHKILAHEYLPDVRYSLWIDGNVEVMPRAPLVTLIKEYLQEADMAVFAHPTRRCLYSEAARCIEGNLDDAQLIMDQVIGYCRAGYPTNHGLVHAAIILRRHSPDVQQFNDQWWREIEKGSRRDQISFNFVARRTGIKICYFPDELRGPLGMFKWRDHVDGDRRLRTSFQQTKLAMGRLRHCT